MAETWVLNERLNLTDNANYIASFTCNGTVYAGIHTTTEVVTYLFNTSQLGGQRAYTNYGWDNEVYRTIVFDESPSGTLLTWLQRNGTKQIDPEPTTPKNACLIDGTAYSIKSGKALIGGVGYGISKGRTLVGGTEYDIILSKKTISLTISGAIITSGSCGSYVQVGNMKYNTSGTYEIESGATITVAAGAARKVYLSSAYILLNGTRYESSGLGILATCSFESETNVWVKYYQRNSGVRAYNYADVTTD